MRGLTIPALVVLAASACAQDAPIPKLLPHSSFWGGFMYCGLDLGALLNTQNNPTFDEQLGYRGYNFGMSLGLAKIGPIADLQFSPSIARFDNMNSNSPTGEVYRFFLDSRFGVPEEPVFVVAGLGYGYTRPWGSRPFNPTCGIMGELGLGIDFSKGPVSPFLQLDYILGNSQMSAVSFMFGIRF